MRQLLSAVAALLMGVVLSMAGSAPVQAQAPIKEAAVKKLQLKPGQRVQGTVSQLDTTRKKLVVKTAKGTVELSGTVNVRKGNGSTVQENLGSPRLLRVGVVVIIERLPNGRIIIIIIVRSTNA
jgi:hypothetical protein